MDKPKINFVIDALMFLCLMSLASLYGKDAGFFKNFSNQHFFQYSAGV